ncbi:MAG: GNAT family N-acetyltransferase [Bacteroidales bacterium]|nr:GNAT family N-acetyltransferase [Bacteroidales bacterium]MCM1147791.1 GNAT family N-acetyltransferase [Bacteroidales bacterium]MCM1206439.1 GNAT family N-acetyltransferase [Bacillota bacterium]MCM1510323.1 GNAT family N-acetyltransferase [Clostridium sp.]
MEIKTLETLSMSEIVASFLEAFADYAVSFTPRQVESLLRRRGFCPPLSYGAFDKGRPVAFVLNGIGVHDGIPTAYDTGTGTIREYRGRGLAAEIFCHAGKDLRRLGIEHYLLEVLSENAPAVALYRKMGFRINREFTCHAAALADIHAPDLFASEIKIRRMDVSAAIQSEAFHDYPPSWQDSYASLLRAGNELACFGAWRGGDFAGYAIADAGEGELVQMAVRRDLRRHGIGSALFSAFLSLVGTERIKAINIDARCLDMISFLEKRNLAVTSRQYEMMAEL